MKTTILSVIAFLIIGVLSPGCEKEDGDTYPVNNKLILIPENPTPQDEIKIIEKEASTCEILSVVVSTDNKIEYTRRFNSSIMMPCSMFTDTVSLGYLQSGDYTIYYSLIDLALQTNDSILEISKLNFTVTGK
ncbi:MAG: hypothetical protein DRI89_02215 [Bacteroidetes bacterium]|nr:MAG: hypothetical protein DRI89_02215 [Bacteroidota bacterium]